MVDMLKTRQCLLGVRTFLGVTSRLWSFFLYILRKHIRTIIQYQTVRYDILPLSPISRNRLNTVKRKILVLDLDETLIHSHHDGVLRPTVRPGTPPDFILKVVIDKHPVRFFVHKRPHVDFFLEVVSQWYELVVFTASMEIYGSAVADKLDNNKGILKRRYYRQHCTLDSGSYIKDLSVVHDDLSSVVILDNSPGAYRSHPDNAIPIKSWFSDPSDTALLNLLPMLDALRFTADVRSVLSRNLHQHRLWWSSDRGLSSSPFFFCFFSFFFFFVQLLPYLTSACSFSLDSWVVAFQKRPYIRSIRRRVNPELKGDGKGKL